MIKINKIRELPRLPLEGSIDLTYRCNNHCLHCWLWCPENSSVQKDEITLDEIERIAGEARAMGCRYWIISGGEPLLRPDFPEIFECLTYKSIGYSLNTNGTLITPEIARLLTRRGDKMIALYGATAEVYDRVTRHPGGFEKAMQGFANLKAAGAGFTVQLIPMKANWHQWDQMIALAKSLSPHIRVGAPWLFLSSHNSLERNREIAAQRLAPELVVALDEPNISYEERIAECGAEKNSEADCCGIVAAGDDRLFAHCIESRRDFHIDPYAQMSWCIFIKDPALRYNLRQGTFEEAWDKFIPACTDKIRGGEEWRRHCGSCDKRNTCRWCAVYSYLETGRYSAPVPYLCSVADAAQQFRREWPGKHRRFFRIAGITVQLESDLDFKKIKFSDELSAFAVDGPGEDNVTLRHYFELPDLKGLDMGKEIYRRAPHIISQKDGTWFYRGIYPTSGDDRVHRLAVFNTDHTRGTIYSRPQVKEWILEKGWSSLSLMATDQIWLGRLLADRNALIFHSSAAIVNEGGLIFIGHSDAGKSTIIEMLKKTRSEEGLKAEILCDDRNVVRKWPEGWRVHGTWSHGDISDVSPSSAPLRAILILMQSKENKLTLITDRKLIWRHLLATLIRPLVTVDWWQKELDILEQLVPSIPCYAMHFDKTGTIVDKLENLTL